MTARGGAFVVVWTLLLLLAVWAAEIGMAPVVPIIGYGG